MNELPIGWAEWTGEDFFVSIRGVSYDKADASNAPAEGTVPILRANNISDGRIVTDDLIYVPSHYVSGDQFLRPGDVLIAASSGSRTVVGKAARATEDHINYAFGAFCTVARPRMAELSSWLEAYMRTRAYREYVERVALGININNLRGSDLRKMPIITPPLPEQRRIVAKIDSLSAKSKRARDHLDHIPRLVEKYKQAILAAAFRGELTREWRQQHRVGGQWSTRSLEELIDEGPTNGWSPKSGADASGAFTLKLTATTSGTLRLDHAAVKRIYEVPPPTSPYWLEPGDLLVQRSNTIEYVGAAAIFDGPCRTYIYPDLMMRIRIKDETNRLYVWRFLNSDEARRYFRERATGTAGNMPKINGGTLRSLPVPLPSTVGERQQIVRRIDTAFTWIDRLAAEATSARKLIDHLDQAVLARAFRGELVPQNPNDEPASVLLERIRAERQSAARQRGSARRTSRSRIRLKE